METPLIRFMHYDKEVFSQHTYCIPRVGETIVITDGDNKNIWLVKDIQYIFAFRPAIGYLPPSVLVSVVSSQQEDNWPEDITLPPDPRTRRR